MEEERRGNIFLLIYIELKLKLSSGLSTRPGHKSKDLNNSAISICPGVHRARKCTTRRFFVCWLSALLKYRLVCLQTWAHRGFCACGITQSARMMRRFLFLRLHLSYTQTNSRRLPSSDPIIAEAPARKRIGSSLATNWWTDKQAGRRDGEETIPPERRTDSVASCENDGS